MSEVYFIPLNFTPSDREALMAFDKGVCEMLEPLEQFARPLVRWELPEAVQADNTPNLNVTIVRKISNDMRLRNYAYVPGLDLTKPRSIKIIGDGSAEKCILCRAPAICFGFFMPNKAGPHYAREGATFNSRTYGLCQKCFDLPDKIERIEKKLGIGTDDENS